jgi:hypothetical protein
MEVTGHFSPGKEHLSRLNIRLSDIQSRSGHFGGQTNMLSLPGSEPGNVKRVASRYTAYSIPDSLGVVSCE